MDYRFIIPLDGLEAGEQHFSWAAGKEFFASFGGEDILDADIKVEADVSGGPSVKVACALEGSITVACDRCLGDLELPVDTGFSIALRHSSQVPEDTDADDVVVIADDASEYGLDQEVYDYAMLSLPLVRAHGEGECDPAVAGRIGVRQPGDATDSPFAKLGEMIGNN